MLTGAGILFLLSLLLFVLDYFVFHYLKSDLRFRRPFREEAEKPFLAMLVGVLAVDLLAAAIVLLVLRLAG